MKVPLFDLTEQNRVLRPQLDAAYHAVMDSNQFVMGPAIEELERLVAPLAGARHALAVSSGTDGLQLALMALGIGPGDQVLVPAFTFFATAGCVQRLGATPVFTDVEAASFNLDVADARRRVTSRTKAIIPVHLFGRAVDMDATLQLAQEYDLAVIEDAAQSLGAKYRGKPVGALGLGGFTSFFPTKNLGCFGDAGMLFTNDDHFAERCRILRVHGMEPKYHHPLTGGNFRMDTLQAAMLKVKVPLLADYSANRRRNAGYYHQQLSAHSKVGVAGVDGDAAIDLLLPPLGDDAVIWNQFTIRITAGAGQRDRLRAHLAERGIGAEIYYPLTLDRQPCFAHLPTPEIPIEVASRLAGECLSLPIYPELKEEQLAMVTTAIIEFLDTE